MLYQESKQDLFKGTEHYFLAHCISADFGMGRGIVVEFNKRFDMKNVLKLKYPSYLQQWDDNGGMGDCLLEGRVFNLITKRNYWNKPTYRSMAQALEQMKALAEENNVTKIAMPVIGCGLDKLEWEKVSDLIKLTFQDTSIEILVCIK